MRIKIKSFFSFVAVGAITATLIALIILVLAKS